MREVGAFASSARLAEYVLRELNGSKWADVLSHIRLKFSKALVQKLDCCSCISTWWHGVARRQNGGCPPLVKCPGAPVLQPSRWSWAGPSLCCGGSARETRIAFRLLLVSSSSFWLWSGKISLHENVQTDKGFWGMLCLFVWEICVTCVKTVPVIQHVGSEIQGSCSDRYWTKTCVCITDFSALKNRLGHLI